MPKEKDVILCDLIWAFDQIIATSSLPILSQFPDEEAYPWMVLAQSLELRRSVPGTNRLLGPPMVDVRRGPTRQASSNSGDEMIEGRDSGEPAVEST